MENLVTFPKFIRAILLKGPQIPLCFLTSLLGWLVFPPLICFLATPGVAGLIPDTRSPPTVAGPGGPGVPESGGKNKREILCNITFHARGCQCFRDNSGRHPWGRPHYLLEL